ncbi:MAG: aminomethyl-transferring glycine dehydrogenase [Saprospiraceae bacterium]|nr:aminomethyl-transferring glycine dehydrogenase [Saprospiraceae bacterium]
MDNFQSRHIGPQNQHIGTMLKLIGVENMEQLIYNSVPDNIRDTEEMKLPKAMTENEYLTHIKDIGSKNKVFKNLIGQGYYGTILPSVIRKNIFENPGWYTQYTPYQAEISQGRLEALINFQTMISDLTGLPIVNSSLLDEGTSAAEALWLMYDAQSKRLKANPDSKVFIDNNIFPQTKEVIETRAEARNITIEYGDHRSFKASKDYFAIIVQYPDSRGSVEDYTDLIKKAKEEGILVTMIADILSLAILTPPGELGADIAVGSTQRFGIPIGFGGPHAAYFATIEDFKRKIPGRIIGVSVDRNGKKAYRMALQTREQHIKREKATSNICTAQALLAIMAGFYGLYHGKEGLINIAKSVFQKTSLMADTLRGYGFDSANKIFFDTLTYNLTDKQIVDIRDYLVSKRINIFYGEDFVSISNDELTSEYELKEICEAFANIKGIDHKEMKSGTALESCIPANLIRTSDFMSHDIFNHFRSESELMRYMKRLENRDLSLVHSMISLGSCTMKLNSAVEMTPVVWSEFCDVHPFAPGFQTTGYELLISELKNYLCEITGFSDCTFQPNSGAQGEFAGLMTIRAYHIDKGNKNRRIALVPSSAHGTNPASAIMAGMDVVIVNSDEKGNIDVADLKLKAEQNKDNLACLMVTYPSTHGVFEKSIIEICDVIHQFGGLVYMDGANMNAQIGITKPSIIGADICHLNLHKTFAIPHGGGGPGVGPVLANKKLSPYLPHHIYETNLKEKSIKAVSSAPHGSAGVLVISHAYIRMMGSNGLKNATEVAILNANYLRAKLSLDYNIVYTNQMGFVAHEMILDLREFKQFNVTSEDVAKRLMDYGFHAPTVSFPVHDTLMIEPTESESQEELDRFCDAMHEIRREIQDIIDGKYDQENNLLKNAPHTAEMVASDTWDLPYSRSEAAYPLPYLKTRFKFWPSVARIDNAFGDRNLFCVCPPIESYLEN